MKNYTFTKQELLHFAEMVYKYGYDQRVFDNLAGKIDGVSTKEVIDQVDELVDFYKDWWGDEEEDELDVPDDVDESNYDPYIGGDFFEADYNLGEAEEWGGRQRPLFYCKIIVKIQPGSEINAFLT